MVYLLRHGLDDESYIGGWSSVDLIDEGIKQVEDVSNFINDNLKIKKIYSSDIKRAITTSKIVSKKLNIPVIYMDIFREQNKGLVNGLPKKEAKKKYKMYLKSMDINLKYPEGESLKDLYGRVINLELEDNSLIITHRGVINMFYYYLKKEPLDLDKKKYNVEHASLHELDIKNGTIKRIY